jgi:hypothetical protein
VAGVVCRWSVGVVRLIARLDRQSPAMRHKARLANMAARNFRMARHSSTTQGVTARWEPQCGWRCLKNYHAE